MSIRPEVRERERDCGREEEGVRGMLRVVCKTIDRDKLVALPLYTTKTTSLCWSHEPEDKA